MSNTNHSHTAATPSWRVECTLVGVASHPDLATSDALLRGITLLYGDGFTYVAHTVSDAAALQRALQSLPGHSDTESHGSVVARLQCTWQDMGEEHVVQGASALATTVRAVLERQLLGHTSMLGTAMPPGSASAQLAFINGAFVDASEMAPPIRIFISGDRSQVGKSTTCLGLLGALLASGYSASELAYIKPATQCEKPQLIAKFCRARSIACCDIGPIVFYSGFTREFLRGQTESSPELLAKAAAAVQALGRGKKVVVIDGVGYPAVGSICGVSNASMAQTLHAPVVLVGKKGVGDAVDSFNLNACFFESHGVPVLGAIFNRLPLDGYYSLAHCRASVTQYFARFQPEKCVYGFIPEMVEPTVVEEEAEELRKTAVVPGHLTAVEETQVNQVVKLVASAVNVAQLVEDARQYQQNAMHATAAMVAPPSTVVAATKKRSASDGNTDMVNATAMVGGMASSSHKKSRHEIQAEAQAAGAAGGCM